MRQPRGARIRWGCQSPNSSKWFLRSASSWSLGWSRCLGAIVESWGEQILFSISDWLSIYLYLSLSVFIYLSIYLSIHPSIYPSIHLSIYPSIHLSINQSSNHLLSIIIIIHHLPLPFLFHLLRPSPWNVWTPCQSPCFLGGSKFIRNGWPCWPLVGKNEVKTQTAQTFVHLATKIIGDPMDCPYQWKKHLVGKKGHHPRKIIDLPYFDVSKLWIHFSLFFFFPPSCLNHP